MEIGFPWEELYYCSVEKKKKSLNYPLDILWIPSISLEENFLGIQ